jgi:hypothetical protein
MRPENITTTFGWGDTICMVKPPSILPMSEWSQVAMAAGADVFLARRRTLGSQDIPLYNLGDGNHQY